MRQPEDEENTHIDSLKTTEFPCRIPQMHPKEGILEIQVNSNCYFVIIIIHFL